MSDLVERLRASHAYTLQNDPTAQEMVGEIGPDAATLFSEAADNIERLREALKWYASDEAWTMEQTEGSNGDYGTKARAALNPQK